MARSRPPGKLLQDVQRMAADGWPEGLVVLSGDSSYHADAAQRAILDAVVESGAGEYGLTIYGDEKVSIGTVVAACRSMGMFADKRVVLVRDLDMLEGDPEPLLDYAAKPVPESHLILRAPKLDRRKKLPKALAKQKLFLHFRIPDDPLALAREIEELAGERGLKLQREAGPMLAHVCNGDLQRASMELDKLATWQGDAKKAITVEDLRAIVAGEGAMSGWELANAIADRDRAAALAAARRLVEAGEEPIRIVGGIAWQARRMMGYGRNRHYKRDELLAFPAHLLEADRALKSRQIPGATVLESLVDRLVGTGSGGA